MRPELLALAAKLSAREEEFALVTVVRREPPSSARVGDTAIVTRAGEYFGWTGGGCTRSTVLRESLRAIADATPRLISLSPRPGADPRTGLITLPMTCDSGGTVEIYVEPVLPAARLLLFGGAPVVRILARIGQATGYRVEVVAPDAQPEQFREAERVSQAIAPDAVPRGAHVVVATMGEDDLEAIAAVIPSAPAYLGVIASRKRFAQLRETLLARGFSAEALDRIASPAGLDIGARTPEEVALSVMAQIVERRRAGVKEEQMPAAALEAIDPICGMSVTIAGARHRAESGGMAYYFCCAGCRTKFLSNLAARAGAR